MSRTYDGQNRLASLTDWLSHTTSFACDKGDSVTATSYPNGTTDTNSYELPTSSQRTRSLPRSDRNFP